MEYTKGDRTKLCSCGNPQSYPIPHEHDWTEREKQIIEYKDGLVSDLYEACKDMLYYIENYIQLTHQPQALNDRAKQALAKAGR